MPTLLHGWNDPVAQKTCEITTVAQKTHNNAAKTVPNIMLGLISTKGRQQGEVA